MNEKLCLSVYGEMYVIYLDNVMYMQADDHYTHIYYSSGTHFLVPFGLSKVEVAVNEKVKDNRFLIRLGRKYIVNLHKVFHVNSVKQILQLSDDHGSITALHLPKPVLHTLMKTIEGYQQTM
ncbi:MAG: LytTR family transcriptional regulator DNA-binding domain-containing protein [Prevotella sp.]